MSAGAGDEARGAEREGVNCIFPTSWGGRGGCPHSCLRISDDTIPSTEKRLSGHRRIYSGRGVKSVGRYDIVVRPPSRTTRQCYFHPGTSYSPEPNVLNLRETRYVAHRHVVPQKRYLPCRLQVVAPQRRLCLSPTAWCGRHEPADTLKHQITVRVPKSFT